MCMVKFVSAKKNINITNDLKRDAFKIKHNG